VTLRTLKLDWPKSMLDPLKGRRTDQNELPSRNKNDNKNQTTQHAHKITIKLRTITTTAIILGNAGRTIVNPHPLLSISIYQYLQSTLPSKMYDCSALKYEVIEEQALAFSGRHSSEVSIHTSIDWTARSDKINTCSCSWWNESDVIIAAEALWQ